MDYTKSKVMGFIREGLLKAQEHRIKATGNPYAAIMDEPDHKALNIDSEIIYNHLLLMGALK